MDHYDAFYHTYLAEMPQRVDGRNAFALELEALRANIENNIGEVTEISSSIFRLSMSPQHTYWIGANDASEVAIIVSTESFEKYRKVIVTSKNPAMKKGSPPFASDLYLAISIDVRAASRYMVFAGDTIISSDAERLWQGLVRRGNRVSVYDTTAREYKLSPVDSVQELCAYIGGVDKRKYLFVLTENEVNQAGITHSVHIMEIKRLCNWPLHDVWNHSNQ